MGNRSLGPGGAPDRGDRRTADINDIRRELLDRLESVLFHLLPNGRISGSTFQVGNVAGDPGHSLVVELGGERRGLWKDFATDEGGDVFDLIAAHQGMDARSGFPDVLVAARDLLGVPLAQRPQRREKKTRGVALGPVTAQWEYHDRDGNLIAVVYRYDPPAGKEYRPWDARTRTWRAPDPRPLYNLPGVAGSKRVVLVEGEKTAQALIDLGTCATTAMNGAKAPVEKTDWSPLAGKQVVIWPDWDRPGWDYAVGAGDAALAAGAESVAILIPPEDKPEKWDAADAVAEGFDVHAFIDTAERIAVRGPAAGGDVPPDDADSTRWVSEDSIALEFTRRHAADWCHVAQWGKWLVWTGKRWRSEETLGAHHLIRQVCREVSNATASAKVGPKLASSGTVSGVERLARSDRRHAASADEWDADPWLLNTPGGVVDLRTRRVSPHRREDRMTKITTATPQGECPTWQAFLEDVTGGDAELRAYLARVVGYCLTGSTREHVLIFLYGPGANGKSVFVTIVATILGVYAANAPMDTFMETRSDRHPTDMAGFRGARLVTATETEEGRRWAESKIKTLTGGDKVSARFMRQDFFEYVPQFKLVIAGNHKPAIRNIDEAMRRRLHLIPFTVTIPPERRDPHLPEKLLAERGGILAWAVAGCLEWRRVGLSPPPSVVAATNEYFETEDAVGRWIEERCFVDVNVRALISDLFADWKGWAEAAGEYVGAVRRFTGLLDKRRFDRYRAHGGGRGFVGIALRQRDFEGSSSPRLNSYGD